MFTGRDIMERASRLLNDEDHIRWTLAEMAQWINEGTLAIVLVAPQACSASRIIELGVGALQYVPVTVETYPRAVRLLSVPRNLKTTGASPRIGGRPVTPAKYEELAAQDPRWNETATFKKEVRHVTFDERAPLEFYVWPGNDGTGILEVVCSQIPQPLDAGVSNPALIATWEQEIGLVEPYSVPLTDYLLYRCFDKDDLAQNTGQATTCYNRFALALGLKIRTDKAQNPNTKPEKLTIVEAPAQ